MIRARSVLKSWFYRGAKPLADQFHDWMDSYLHRDEDLAYICLYEYDPSRTYPSGVSVIHQGFVYQSVNATTGTWNASDWLIIGNVTEVYYMNSNPTTVTAFGIPAGTTFDNVSMSDMWSMLLYPYQQPAFSSFFADNLAGTYEAGYMIQPDTHVFTWTTSHDENVKANSIGLSGAGMDVITDLPNDGSESVLFLSPVGRNTPGSLYWTITGQNTNDEQIQSLTFSATWMWKTYWGNSAETSLTSAQILQLAGQVLSNTYAGTRAFAAADYQYKWIFYPASFGTATRFTDASTMLGIPFESPVTVSVTNAYSQTTSYRGHRSSNMLGGAVNIIIS